jgi:galactonate dehydratase
MAEAYYAAMLPHCKEGIIGAVASMHVAASIPNLLSHELPGMFTTDTRVERSYLGKSYVKKPLTLGRDGCILIAGNLNAPGLGVELDDNLVENERGVEEWEFPPMWDSQDGSVNDH